MEDARRLLTLPATECPQVWIRPFPIRQPAELDTKDDPTVLLDCGLFVAKHSGTCLWNKRLPHENWRYLSRNICGKKSMSIGHSQKPCGLVSGSRASRTIFFKLSRKNNLVNQAAKMFNFGNSNISWTSSLSALVSCWRRATSSSAQDGTVEDLSNNYHSGNELVRSTRFQASCSPTHSHVTGQAP